MLKFFRQYNKWFLAVGGTLLMIAFLIQPAMDMFQPQMGGEEIGQIRGEEVTLGERIQAANDLELLARLSPVLRTMVPSPERDGGMLYLLMQREAQDMGVSASEAEVNEVLMGLGVQPGSADMTRLLQTLRIPEGALRGAIRRWIVVQNYIPLVQGRAYLPLARRMEATEYGLRNFNRDQAQALEVLALSQGLPRLSEPLLTHFLANQHARLDGEVVLIGHERYLDQVGEPADEALADLFNRHREHLPGNPDETNPYGFGYRTPARVKVEWLQIPAEAVEENVQIDEAEAIAYFEDNHASYTGPDDAQLPYIEARDRVYEELRRQKALVLGQQAARAAQSALQDDPALRRLPRSGSYLAVPADFQPLPLDAAAGRAAERTGVTPLVHAAPEGWTVVEELSTLPGIGFSALVGRQGVFFADYVRSARELEPAPTDPRVALRLQRGVPSEVLQGFDGSYYVFRIVAAEPSQAPESLDAVREAVAEDWRKLQAFERLQQERDRLVATAQEKGLQGLADELQTAMLHVNSVARREQPRMYLGLETPTLPGIGKSDELLDAMFDAAETVARGEGEPIGSFVEAGVEESVRVGAAPVNERLSVAVFRVDSYQPISRSTYRSHAYSPMIGPAVDRVLLKGRDLDSLSIEAIAARIGYTGEGLGDEGESAEGAGAADAG